MSLHNSPDKEYLIQLEKYAGTAVIFGEGAFSQLGNHLMLEQIQRVTFVLGGKNSSITSGVTKAFMNMLSGFDLEAPTVSDIPAEPDCDDVRRIVAEFNEQQPEVVIAVGGGSVMDAAKAAYLSWQTGLDVKELFGVNKVSGQNPGKRFNRVICIPTTAGTGSEVTPYSNIVDREMNVKRLIMEQEIVPDYAFVDPQFTWTMPRNLTVTTALDALVHAIESFLNTKSEHAGPVSDEWAMTAIKLIRYALPIAEKEPENALAREMLSAAATLGGMCIGCRPTSLPHLCSFSLFGEVPHGVAVAGFLPVFWRYYLAEEAVRKQTMRLAGIFPGDVPQTTPEQVVDACEAFLRSMTDLPVHSAETIRRIADNACGNPMKLESAPRKIDPATASDVLNRILSGSL